MVGGKGLKRFYPETLDCALARSGAVGVLLPIDVGRSEGTALREGPGMSGPRHVFCFCFCFVLVLGSCFAL